MAVTISVYEKRGLVKRGNPILDAEFRQAVVLSESVTAFPVLSATGGGPLGEPKYAVELLSSPATVSVASVRHNEERFLVRDGETHEVWLSRR
jgi:hypothetical protein